jgi:hypothetical protein
MSWMKIYELLVRRMAKRSGYILDVPVANHTRYKIRYADGHRYLGFIRIPTHDVYCSDAARNHCVTVAIVIEAPLIAEHRQPAEARALLRLPQQLQSTPQVSTRHSFIATERDARRAVTNIHVAISRPNWSDSLDRTSRPCTAHAAPE